MSILETIWAQNADRRTWQDLYYMCLDAIDKGDVAEGVKYLTRLGGQCERVLQDARLSDDEAVEVYKLHERVLRAAAKYDFDTWSKLVDIKDFPDLGGSPEMLETTTLSDAMQTYIAGIQSLDALEFTANYDVTKFSALKDLEHTAGHYAVWFGTDASGDPDGHNGKFTFDGELSVFPVGGGVNEVVDMTITIAPSTPIAFSVPTT